MCLWKLVAVKGLALTPNFASCAARVGEGATGG